MNAVNRFKKDLEELCITYVKVRRDKMYHFMPWSIRSEVKANEKIVTSNVASGVLQLQEITM